MKSELKPKRKFTRRIFVRGGIFSAASLLLGGKWATAVEPRWFDVEHIEMPLPRLEKSFDGYRIAQLSDIHFGDGMNRARLMHAVQKTNELKPDLIAITGDFVSHWHDHLEKDFTACLRELRARDGVVAVLGNHDHWTGPGGVRRTLRAAGVRELANNVSVIRRGREQLFIVGADDPWCKKANIAPIVKHLPARGAAILLAHEPDYADNFCRYGRFDLQLSGHSHGGQVTLPFLGPLLLPGAAQKYPRGQYQVKDMILYTNRGIGTTGARGIYPRFNCRPEISLFTLRTV